MPSRAVDLETIQEWRELGFFYSFDEKAMIWIVRGDRKGLMDLVEKIRAYGTNPKNNAISEHDHLGPYFYLKIMTWNSPEITASAWSGSLTDLVRLSNLIEQKLSNLAENNFFIGSEYSSLSTAKIHFIIESDGFDPSSVDADIQHRS